MRSAAAFLALTLFASACAPAGIGISVREAWARPSSRGMNAAAYFTIENAGPADALLSAQTEVADTAELHRSRVDDQGIASMERQEQVELPANGRVPFEPGGLHLMLINLERDLAAGDSFELQLSFENHDPISVSVHVRSP